MSIPPARSSSAFGASSSTPRATSRSRPTRAQALEYYKKLIAFLPPDAPAWDDASNNKWLVSGKGAMIMNPPSAWAVAKRDAPQGRRAVLDARLPGRTEGPLRAVPALFLGHLELLQEQGSGQEPAVASVAAGAVEKMVAASGGYDLPAFEKLTTFKTWAEEGPPKGTLYHYPNPHNHQTLSIAAAPAPPKIAQQIYTQAT
jgi:ABC-type glycerol-3-phosphate transport system substrate-binding protein